MAASIFKWKVVTLGGSQLPLGSGRTFGITSVVEQIEQVFGPRSISYDKIWRGLKKEKAYTQLLELPPMFGEQKPQKVTVIISPSSL